MKSHGHIGELPRNPMANPRLGPIGLQSAGPESGHGFMGDPVDVQWQWGYLLLIKAVLPVSRSSTVGTASVASLATAAVGQYFYMNPQTHWVRSNTLLVQVWDFATKQNAGNMYNSWWWSGLEPWGIDKFVACQKKRWLLLLCTGVYVCVWITSPVFSTFNPKSWQLCMYIYIDR